MTIATYTGTTDQIPLGTKREKPKRGDGIEAVTHCGNIAWGLRWQGELLAMHFGDYADAEVHWYLLRGEPVPRAMQKAANERRALMTAEFTWRVP